MRFDTSQHMNLSQQMKLAPRMIQSMEILQMPMMALQERIDQELESNVALELGDPDVELEEADKERREDEREERLQQRELVIGDEQTGNAADFERLGDFESSYSEAFDNEYSSGKFAASRQAGERDKKMDAMANVAARGESLTDQLLHQWALTDVDPETAELGARLIAYIDNDGLLSADLATIAEQARNVPGADVTVEKLQSALKEVQQRLDPPGIGARDLRECLLLQIEAREHDSEDEHNWSDVRTLILNHFDDLLQNRLPRIEKSSELTLDRIHKAKELMRKLNLHPGRELVVEDAVPVIPDVVIEYDEESDEYVGHLADSMLPRLRVSSKYDQMARDRKTDRNTRDFLGNQVRNAGWLIDAIRQRNATLMRVVNVVLTRQREFFDNGPQALRPLPMIEVADQLGIHVGTVSRAVADKWMETPRGVVPLRRFFSGGTETESGEAMSWDAVKATLKEIVEGEDKSSPLSDEALAAELKKRGIDIARRTVVKYRQQMSIPSARQRKQF
jgi:RNA polymerase sigma-54 factor